MSRCGLKPELFSFFSLFFSNTSLFYLPLSSQAFLPKQTGNFSPDLFLTLPSHFGTTGGQKTKLELQGLAEGTVVVSLTLLWGPAHTAILAGQLAARSQRVSQKWRPQCSPQQPPHRACAEAVASSQCCGQEACVGS